MSSKNNIENEVRRYCAEIGEDPLLVQGAGGNVSWKANGALWIKASGTWLAHAVKDQIFIPVDLAQLRSDLNEKKWDAIPSVICDSQLKPSIETALHALMPHRVVVHIHAIEVLAHLVRNESYDYFHDKLGGVCSFALIDYHKPGPPLAAAVGATLASKAGVELLLLKNHGIVVGADNVSSIRRLIEVINALFSVTPALENKEAPLTPQPHGKFRDQYSLVDDVSLQQLALHPALFQRLFSDWALYPDHVVFLGSEACAYDSWLAFESAVMPTSICPEIVFIYESGVFTRQPLTGAKLAQLRSYLDVMVRQNPNSSLVTLNSHQIAELQNWDAERYRVSLDV